MKKRLKEIEDESAALREMQAKVEKEMGASVQQGFSSSRILEISDLYLLQFSLF